MPKNNTSPVKTQPEFKYQARTPEQWRALTRDCRPIGEDARRLSRILSHASRSVILSDWQLCFCFDLEKRFAQYGDRLILSTKQRAALNKIATKLGVARL